MRHLDEAELSAWLDGEADERSSGWADTHLSSCGACMARLEEMRVTRDRARDILRSGAPSGVRLSFKEILARRAVVAPRRRVSGVRSLAWAASIVLALSVGWYAREVTVMREATVQQLADGRTGGRAETTDRLNVDTAPKLAARPVPEIRAQAEPAVVATQTRAKTAEVANVVVATPAAQPPSRLAADVPAVQPPSRLAAAVEDQLKKEQISDPRDTMVLRLDEVVVTSAASAEAEAKSAKAPVTVARRALSAAGVAAPAAAPAPASARGFAAADVAPAEWTRADLLAATSALGRPPLTAPGLEIIQYEVGQSGVRVTQRMATGILELIEQRADSRDERAVTGPGVGALVEGIQIRLWGPVSYDSLRAIVGNLR